MQGHLRVVHFWLVSSCRMRSSWFLCLGLRSGEGQRQSLSLTSWGCLLLRSLCYGYSSVRHGSLNYWHIEKVMILSIDFLYSSIFAYKILQCLLSSLWRLARLVYRYNAEYTMSPFHALPKSFSFRLLARLNQHLRAYLSFESPFFSLLSGSLEVSWDHWGNWDYVGLARRVPRNTVALLH